MRQKPPQIIPAQRNTSRGRSKCVAGDVDKNGAAKPGDAGARIVVDLDNKIVEAILAAQPVAWFTGRALESPVIAAV